MTPLAASLLVLFATLWLEGVLWMVSTAQRERSRADLYRRLRGTR